VQTHQRIKLARENSRKLIPVHAAPPDHDHGPDRDTDHDHDPDTDHDRDHDRDPDRS
jgi:hypothetical protein